MLDTKAKRIQKNLSRVGARLRVKRANFSVSGESRPIGVFDSGIGGLSILYELKKILPQENFVFLADQKHVPYGEKSKKELIKITAEIANYFSKNHKIKMLVVACNTATCYTIDELRAKNSFPVVGTVPAIKPAAEKSATGTIAVISTPATSESKILEDLITAHSRGVKVLNIGCKDLGNAVEQGNLSGAKVNSLLKKYLTQVKNSNADHLVLGCTHYPFLKKPIRKVVGSEIKIIDSSSAIARRVASLLKVGKIGNRQKRKGKTLYFSTGDPEKFSEVASKLLKTKVKAKQVAI